MSGKILKEIKQGRPFEFLDAEAFVNVLKTADSLTQRLVSELKPYGLSPTQYNVLRILRGAGEPGASCGEVASRMITRDPDITRLLDRLEQRRLVSRCRENKDRRVITVRITGDGLALLKELEEPLSRMNKRLLGHLGEKRLRTLIELLELVRRDSAEPG